MDSTAINDSSESSVLSHNSPTNGLPWTLSTVSGAAMNTLKIITNTENKPATTASAADHKHGQECQPDSFNDTTGSKAVEKGDAIAMPHPTTSGRMNMSFLTSQTRGERSPIPRTSPIPATPSVRMISAEFGSLRTYSSFPIAEDSTASNGTALPQWSSAVGRANLGKSGRVIEKLMADNDMLKRELQIAKLAADESKEEAKLMGGRMEALSSEFDARQHDATITKTLLKKRDRQVTDLKAQIEGERQRAKEAVERERSWRVAMEKMEVETKQKVDEATNYALLMEGRNNTLTSHWKEQGAFADATVSKLSIEISAVRKDRENDIRRMDLLEELCSQKDEALANLEKQKDNILAAFEAYKVEQESRLQGIKSRAIQQEKENEELHEQTQRVLGELRWALAIRRDIRGAE